MSCPNCGYCPHCGRRDWNKEPSYPPIQPNPYEVKATKEREWQEIMKQLHSGKETK